MAARKKRKSDIELKNDIQEQIKKLQQQAEEIDNKRADKIGKLAKETKIINLDDNILKDEFLNIYNKYVNEIDPVKNLDDKTKKSGQGSTGQPQNSQELETSNAPDQQGQNF